MTTSITGDLLMMLGICFMLYGILNLMFRMWFNSMVKYYDTIN